uniref:MYND-type domain-containing protein n=1 Tax=Chromera velia CCMP2878 TaxID=1169474 RepID=A0A0G4GE41_9ALVE|eukprot:Cvel_614.t1-p1 / transcript=Cvel_614.t1 / gene=Cvel_614 / organism=Chromera_velia_CCMP2878 / gene_product=hypothetical protein / transcript_product=hypothetical protein / location=Cvel_scaffold19:28372-29583(-) / protein_length=311 / sequence_SO=supercontig / SO=protein_coding / is_pseudo=false
MFIYEWGLCLLASAFLVQSVVFCFLHIFGLFLFNTLCCTVKLSVPPSASVQVGAFTMAEVEASALERARSGSELQGVVFLDSSGCRGHSVPITCALSVSGEDVLAASDERRQMERQELGESNSSLVKRKGGGRQGADVPDSVSVKAKKRVAVQSALRGKFKGYRDSSARVRRCDHCNALGEMEEEAGKGGSSGSGFFRLLKEGPQEDPVDRNVNLKTQKRKTALHNEVGPRSTPQDTLTEAEGEGRIGSESNAGRAAPTDRVSLKRCSRCESAVYCSEACQAAAWKEHKRTCTSDAEAQERARKTRLSLVG